MGPQRGELGLQGRALGSFDTELMLTVLGHSPRLRRVPLGLGKLCLQVLGPLTQSLMGFVALTLSLVKPRPHLTVAGVQLTIGLPEAMSGWTMTFVVRLTDPGRVESHRDSR